MGSAIVGGGFAGSSCANELDDARVDVLLVDSNNYQCSHRSCISWRPLC